MSQKQCLPGLCPHPRGLLSTPVLPCSSLRVADERWLLTLGSLVAMVSPTSQGLQKGDLAVAQPAAELWPVDLDDVLDGPPADGAAGPCLPSEPQAAAVAEAHVSARIDDRVHLAVEAHGTLPVPAACCRFRCREGWRHRGAQRGAGGCHCQKGDGTPLMAWLSGGLCWASPRTQCSHGGNGAQGGDSPIFVCLLSFTRF